jgi:hypothetical protein
VVRMWDAVQNLLYVTGFVFASATFALWYFQTELIYPSVRSGVHFGSYTQAHAGC